MLNVYLITNTINGKKYVGQTKTKIMRRWSAHKRDSKRVDNLFYRAIRKYGPDAFEVVLLEDWETQEEVNDAETWWIKILDTQNSEFGYNIKPGGGKGPLPESVKQNISKAHLKRFEDNPELREQRGLINRGRKFSDEARENMSKGHLGIKLPEFTESHKQGISNSLKETWKERPWTTGPKTEDQKQRISSGLVSYHANKTPEEKEAFS